MKLLAFSCTKHSYPLALAIGKREAKRSSIGTINYFPTYMQDLLVQHLRALDFEVC